MPFPSCAEDSREAKRLPWVIKPRNLFNIFRLDLGEDELAAGALLVDITAAGLILGDFRWSLAGARHVRISMQASDIVPVAGLEEFHLTMEIRPDEVEIRRNLMSGDWQDLADMVGKGRIIASRGDEDDGHDLLGKHSINSSHSG